MFHRKYIYIFILCWAGQEDDSEMYQMQLVSSLTSYSVMIVVKDIGFGRGHFGQPHIMLWFSKSPQTLLFVFMNLYESQDKIRWKTYKVCWVQDSVRIILVIRYSFVENIEIGRNFELSAKWKYLKWFRWGFGSNRKYLHCRTFGVWLGNNIAKL